MKRSHQGLRSSGLPLPSSLSSLTSLSSLSSTLSSHHPPPHHHHHSQHANMPHTTENPLFAVIAGGSSGATHDGVTCDGCSIASFSGIRHKCSVCFDYDLCDECFLGGVATKSHDPSHAMQTILPSGGGSVADFESYLGDEFEGEPLDLSIDRDSRRFRSPPSSSSTTTFKCPYCGGEGFIEQELCFHVNSVHAGDSTPVVCPICAIKPGGDPMYISRNFHGHLELRHLQSDERSKRLLNRAAKAGLFATSATNALLSSSSSTSRLLSELTASKQKNPPAKVARLSNLPPVPVKYTPPPTTLLPSLEPQLTEEEIVESNNKKILRGIFLRELLFSTLVEKPKQNR